MQVGTEIWKSQLSIGDELVAIAPRLRLFALSRVFAEADADDLVSRTCIRVLEKQADFEPGTNLMAWAITILRNLHLDDYRTQKRRGQHTAIDQLTTGSHQIDELAERRIQSNLEASDLHKAVHQLPDGQREVVVLWGGGMTYQEIANELGIENGTVMSRLSRARSRLAELMGQGDG